MKIPSPGWMSFMQAQLEKEEREKERAKSATLMICPRCGGKLHEREGKYGKFLGCGNYPNCKYTQKI